jgi:hypothetical protein
VSADDQPVTSAGTSTAGESSATVPEPAAASSASSASSWVVPVLLDVLIIGAWFAAAGLVGGWLWAHLTSLPQVAKEGNSATVASEELAKQVAMDGWFFLIAAIGGVVSGLFLLVWRRRDPILAVVLVTLGGGLASWLMVHAGEAFGPGDPIAALRQLPDGAHVSEQLRLHAPGVAWVWPIAAAFGALLYFWVLKPADDEV